MTMYKTEVDHELFNFSDATHLPNRDGDSCTARRELEVLTFKLLCTFIT